MIEDNKYPDLGPPPNGLGDLRELKPIRGQRIPAPQIRWGNEYKSWPIERRLDFAEKLASSMNHAADLLQQERNKLIEIAKAQEEQLKSTAKSYTGQGQLMHKELAVADVEKQQLYQEIVALKVQIKNLQAEVAGLKRELHRS